MYVKLLKWKYLGRGKLNTHNKNINLGRVREIKILRIFLLVGHPRDPKGEDHGYLSTFRGINAPKSGPFK